MTAACLVDTRAFRHRVICRAPWVTVRLHRRITHHLLNACLIHGELRQMRFGRCMSRRHSSKLLLHPLKEKARPRQPRHVVVALVFGQECALPSDAVLLVLNVLSG
jgi:hypothetical protein